MDGRLRHGVEDVRRRQHEQLHGPPVPLGDRHDAREQHLLVVGEQLFAARCRGRRRPAREEPNGQHDDVALLGVGVVTARSRCDSVL